MRFKAPVRPTYEDPPAFPLRIASPRIFRADRGWEDHYRPHPEYTIWRMKVAQAVSIAFLVVAILAVVLPDHAVIAKLATAGTVVYIVISYRVIRDDIARISALTGPQSWEVRTVQPGLDADPDFLRLHSVTAAIRQQADSDPDNSDIRALEIDAQLALWKAAGCTLEIPELAEPLRAWLLASADDLEQRLADVTAAAKP